MPILSIGFIAALASYAAVNLPLNNRSEIEIRVTAMCAPNGITAEIMFDGPFPGKIYSSNYGTTHECVYYNLVGLNLVFFSIPNHRCGTKLTRNARNVVDRIENEVYVQMDKDAQTNPDRRYHFVCQLNRRDFYFPNLRTFNPFQTVLVQTIEAERIIATQTSNDVADIFMEIQKGDGPFASSVSTPLKLGETITLVIEARKTTAIESDQYNVFVHSCFATDGSGVTKVDLIDRSGCTIRHQVAGRLQRIKTDTGRILYFFRMSAFKFPGPDDVYFSCSVDLCDQCNFSEICPTNENLLRNRRSSFNSTNYHALLRELFDNVKIEAKKEDYQTHVKSTATSHCFTEIAILLSIACFISLIVTLVTMLICVIFKNSVGGKVGIDTIE